MTREPITLRMCIDRALTTDQKAIAILAAEADEGGDERPPMTIGVERWKLWRPKAVLRVGFFAGDDRVKDRVFARAKEWEEVVSIRFERVADPRDAQIRISFDESDGSWSYVGRECLGIPRHEATMNFGWLFADTDEVEYSRTVLHEFGHALGCVHEHQVPGAGVPWDEEKVLEYFKGPPNRWTEAEIRANVLDRYSEAQVNSTEFDRHSIMIYGIDRRLLREGEGFPDNSALSAKDREFMRKIYP